MINIGIVGANETSKRHIEKLIELKEFKLVGFYDHDSMSASMIEDKYQIPRFEHYKDLIKEVDAVNILTPVGSHYQYASNAIRNCRHVFVKQVLSENLDEAKELNQLADEANIQLYVSHHEKFHPNYQTLKRLLDQPFYIESARFDPHILNYTEENMVFDLLLNELELVLNLVKAKVKRVRATGACLHHNHVDFINARIEFDNGCVLNMVCGNFKSEQKNSIQFFQRNRTYNLNLDNFKITMLNSSVPEQVEHELNLAKTKNVNDMIKRELSFFASSISNHSLKLRTHYDNYQTLEVAHEIIDKLNINKR
ncbi:MAG: Gfo/Idh/MocA family oxidoreductase [Sphingobacteriales bacterium]|jgi:predicted dehydrogenase|nr:Gfo/Idh/MocA family oxidoreductase [Sphingobacteriales bacterium]